MKANLAISIRRFLADEDGAFIIEFGIAFPMLILLSFGLLQFSLVMFDYQRAAEATRRGVRLTIITTPIPNTAQLLVGSVIQCTSTGGAVSCTGGSPSEVANEHFQAVLAEMQQAYPSLTEENLIITYEGTDVGAAGTAGGILPLVTLQVRNVRHDMIVGSLVGIPYIEFPEFTTTVLGPGNYVNVVTPSKANSRHPCRETAAAQKMRGGFLLPICPCRAPELTAR